MEISKRLGELEQEVNDLGLKMGEPTGRGGKYQKLDYVRVLAAYHMSKKYNGIENIPKNLKFRYSFKSPQLAEQYSKLRPEQQDAIWTDENIWMTEKVRGVRGTLVVNKALWNLYSREISADDYCYLDYMDRVIPGNLIDPEGTIACDVEIELNNQEVTKYLKEKGFNSENDVQVVSTLLMMDEVSWVEVSTQFKKLFRLKLIDVYYLGKLNLRKEVAYKEREEHFDQVVRLLKKAGVHIDRPKICKEAELKKAFHEGIMQQGGEGTIAVFIDKPCNLTGNRRRDEWVKIKRSVFNLDDDALDDTVDGWIGKVVMSEQYPDMAQEIEVFATVEKDGGNTDQKIAVVNHIPLSLRKELKEGMVVELSGTALKEGVVENPILQSIRFDKPKHECVVSV